MKTWYTYAVVHYSAIRKDEILPLVTAIMDLENIMLSETSQKYDFTHMWDIKLKFIDSDNSMVVPRGKGVGE